jgi:hypothetical protein
VNRAKSKNYMGGKLDEELDEKTVNSNLSDQLAFAFIRGLWLIIATKRDRKRFTTRGLTNPGVAFFAFRERPGDKLRRSGREGTCDTSLC